MHKRVWGLAAFLAAAAWPFVSTYFWEFIRSVFYEQALKMIHPLVDAVPLELWERYAPSAAFAIIGLYLFFKTGKQQTTLAGSVPGPVEVPSP